MFQVAARQRGCHRLGLFPVWPVLDEEGVVAADGENRGSMVAGAAMEMVVCRLSGERDEDNYRFVREAEEMGNHRFVGETESLG